MNAALALFTVLLIGLSNCGKYSEPAVNNSQPAPVPSPTAIIVPDLTDASDKEWHESVGKTIVARGKFSLGGIVGPFISIGERVIYITATGNYSWGKEYRRMEGKDVKVTGTFGFRHYEPSPDQHPPDYFYFQAETAKIELVK